MKRWSSRRLFLLSQIWKVLQEILKSPLPVWLTGRLSLAGNSPKFNSSSASSSTQSFDESTSCARSPESERSAQTRPSMVSNFPKPPPDSSPRNAGQCGRSNSVLFLYFLRIPNILGIFPKYCKQFKIFTGSKVSVTNAAVAEHLQSVLTSYGRG